MTNPTAAALEMARGMYTKMCEIFNADRDYRRLDGARDECLDVFAAALINERIEEAERAQTAAERGKPMMLWTEDRIAGLRKELEELKS